MSQDYVISATTCSAALNNDAWDNSQLTDSLRLFMSYIHILLTVKTPKHKVETIQKSPWQNAEKVREHNQIIYLAFAGSDPDDPTDFAIPILQGQKRR